MLLQQNHRIPVFLEPIHSWTFLDKFYQDPKKWGFAFNTEVLMSMYQWKHCPFSAIYERSPMSCRSVFTQIQYEEDDMDDLELALFDKLYKEFSWVQDVIIYLDTPSEVCYDRMQQRARSCENEVTLDYLDSIYIKHEEMLIAAKQMVQPIRVYRVDGTKDIQEVYQDVLNILKKENVL